MQKVYLLLLMPVCVGSVILAAYFCHPCLSQLEYNWSLIKVGWLDACIALRVDGAILVVLLRRWRKIYTIFHPMGSKADT
jgi:hypothetical protein